MRRSDFSYPLPDELIAQHPPAERSAGQMLVLTRSGIEDRMVRELPQFLQPGDLLVLNDTRVIPARLYAHKPSGGRVEILIERVLDGGRFLAQLRVSHKPAPGSRLRLEEGPVEIDVLGRDGEFFELRFEDVEHVETILEKYGHVPLPPYIRRGDGEQDHKRYQTIYAREPGAVAAPTAGLHIDEDLLDRIRDKGVAVGYVTLHVGAGTFQPVRTEDLSEHRMHSERVAVDETLCRQVRKAKRVVAVGTTVVRALETACRGGAIEPYSGETDLFIYPGYAFRTVDLMLTNFHAPETTLLMLVCAFAGREHVLDAYRHAIENRYRLLSYGDAMLVERQGEHA